MVLYVKNATTIMWRINFHYNIVNCKCDHCLVEDLFGGVNMYFFVATTICGGFLFIILSL